MQEKSSGEPEPRINERKSAYLWRLIFDMP